ncbi:MAG TPA: 23S rRNA (uracil(1939)-C(5))-methyltransferase RlmD [Candidatus Scatomonas pullistercoris]|uniref:23S rRNA (Uracil(1939)-C(5))-methyltransferase RlmD n=1 Tax=Candidatus Scatomonas pullistercoris TaxID=2840920 RepID=A0A9D1TA23_9FIRM|nr:23S rRNA (uracil(1939)-C(5))-methyltransferase RlmD [Candidatus Scatomonas pullistercoris]
MSIGTNKSPEACPAAKKCGGCAYQGISYEEQLKIKTDKVRRLLRDLCPVRAVVGMENPYHYRNKIHAAFGRLRDGRIISGIYQEGTHKIVPVDDCLIEDETADAIIRDIRGLLPSFKIQIYNEDSGRGLLRHVLIRRGFATGQVLVALVLASPILPSKNNFVRALRKLHPEIATIVLNINDKKTSMVLGERNITLYGKGYIEDILCGKTFRISPNSFYQVNPVQTERLYRKAVELAGLTGKERVMDAYCGIGTIGMAAADQAGEVIGVELNRAAVRDAISSAKANGVKNIRFMAGDAGEFLEDMAARGERADVVFMDPPRAGSTEKFMDSVAKMGAGRVVYVSCNPETLARDLKYLKRKGYVAEEAWVVDMFPWTESIETVCLLKSNK